jgi:hypothetical protein
LLSNALKLDFSLRMMDHISDPYEIILSFDYHVICWGGVSIFQRVIFFDQELCYTRSSSFPFEGLISLKNNNIKPKELCWRSI